MRKDVKVDRPSKTVDHPSLSVATGDDVHWTISSITKDEVLVLKSLDTDPNFSTLGDTGKKGIDNIKINIPNLPGLKLPHTFPYEISVQTDSASSVVVVTDSLVIDTIGMPAHGYPHGHRDGDEPRGDDHGHEGRD